MGSEVLRRGLVLSAALALLAGCGGGGGGGTVGVSPSASPASGASVAVANVRLSGAVTYDSVPNITGALNYAATVAKPVRGAVVEILNAASNIVASANTDEKGLYSVAVPSNTSLIVRVKAQLSQLGAGPSWDVSVRDNTQANAIYAMETPTFASGTAAVLARDVHAPSGWGGSGYSGMRVAAPFALLDTIYTAQAKVLSVAPNTAFPALRVFWSANNVPASGNPALGQIGTTFFGNGTGGRTIFVLGKENVDSDEYDESVIAHEWGHYYQSAFSRDDSPGGSHAITDRLDRRVAFSEGWGNAWSGIALGRSNYIDSVGPGQAQGSNVDLRAGDGSDPGWFREASVQSILWILNGQVGFKAIHDTMTGPFKRGLPVTSIHPFAAAFYLTAPEGASNLSALLTGQKISAFSDPYGVLEMNDGGVQAALPMYQSAAAGAVKSACVSNQAGAGNKLGSYAYLRLTAPAAGTHTITVLADSSAVDPDWVVYSGGQIAEADGLGQSEAASVNFPAGESILVINDFNNTSASTCFKVTIQ